MDRRSCLSAIVFAFLLIPQIAPVRTGSAGPLLGYAPWPTHSWMRASPKEVNLNSTVLQNMVEYFSNDEIAIDSLIVVRRGYLVVEEYFSHYAGNDLHHLFSVTKSILSPLVGIAEDRDFIDSVNASMLAFFQDKEIESLDNEKKAVTIEHLLRMTAGLDWSEEYYTAELNDYNRMIRSEDWIQYVINKQVVYPPGSVFQYNSGLSHLLSAIIQTSSNMTTAAFADRYLFEPLGIEDYKWGTDPRGINEGGSKLKLKPLDMAKIGYLFLRGGLWDGVQIIPQNWIQETSTTLVKVNEKVGYSLHWWTLPELNAYFALGWGSQGIIVLPDAGIVTVITAATLHESADAENILYRWILPSLGINKAQTRMHLRFSPALLILAGGPFALIVLVHIWDQKRLWED